MGRIDDLERELKGLRNELSSVRAEIKELRQTKDTTPLPHDIVKLLEEEFSVKINSRGQIIRKYARSES